MIVGSLKPMKPAKNTLQQLRMTGNHRALQ